MIPSGVEVFVAVEPIDLRWGFDRLAGVVHDTLGREARSRALFVFFSRRRAAIKVLFFDGTGLCLFYKRLDRGTFRLPERLDEHATSIAIDERELDDLLDGLVLEDTARPSTSKPARGVH
jgi:transposase